MNRAKAITFTLLFLLSFIGLIFNTGCAVKSDQRNPGIYENIVVWQDKRYGQWDIYGYDLDTQKEFRITEGKGDSITPKIQGNIVVWTNINNGIYDIYGHNLETKETFRITQDQYKQKDPDVYGDRVVWTDYREKNGSIYCYNIGTGVTVKLSKGSESHFSPSIYGDNVVWIYNKVSNPYSKPERGVYCYNFNSGTSSFLPTETISECHLFKDIIIWNPNMMVRIGGYNLGPDMIFGTKDDIGNFEADVDEGDAINFPRAYDNIIACETAKKIYMHNTQSEDSFIIEFNQKGSLNFSIYGNIIVAEVSVQNRNWDIYGYNLDTKEEFPICVK